MPKAARSQAAAARKNLNQDIVRADIKPRRELSHTDIVMSIKPEHMHNIASQVKNHEYRKYLLPASVQRIWLYSSAPAQEIRYIAAVGAGKRPGQVVEDGGLGNQDFNAGRKVSKFGYEILELWELRHPLSLALLKSEGYLRGPPQKYCWALQSMIENIGLDERRSLFRRKPARLLALAESSSSSSSSPSPQDAPNPMGSDIRNFFP